MNSTPHTCSAIDTKQNSQQQVARSGALARVLDAKRQCRSVEFGCIGLCDIYLARFSPNAVIPVPA